jgi:DHA3 family macrolide efflux protein-like MFS transporter
MSMSYFGGTSTHASITEIVFSVGFMMGSVVLSAWGGTKNRVYTVFGSYVLMGGSLLIAGMLPTSGFWFFAVCSWLIGFSGPFYWGTYTPIIQTHFNGEYLGRVLTLTGCFRYFFGPLGLGLESILSEHFGISLWFTVAGILVLIAAALILVIPAVRTCDSSEQNH